MRRESPLMPVERVEQPALVWERAGGAPLEFTVSPDEPVTIGREAANTIAIDSPFISKAHAVVQHAHGQYMVEDLRSSNGTRVNGVPIATSSLKPGDVIEIGEHRFTFVDRSPRARRAPAAHRAAPGRGLSKTARLALAAIGALFVLMLATMLILPSSGPAPDAAATDASSGGTTARGQPARQAPRSITPADTELVTQVLATAKTAGVRDVDALYDEGMLQSRAGRLREAAQLFAAALARDKNHELARNRLAEVQNELEGAIATNAGEAERAFQELRYDSAIVAWEQVLLLADLSDQRYKAAQAGIERARERIRR